MLPFSHQNQGSPPFTSCNVQVYNASGSLKGHPPTKKTSQCRVESSRRRQFPWRPPACLSWSDVDRNGTLLGVQFPGLACISNQNNNECGEKKSPTHFINAQTNIGGSNKEASPKGPSGVGPWCPFVAPTGNQKERRCAILWGVPSLPEVRFALGYHFRGK